MMTFIVYYHIMILDYRGFLGFNLHLVHLWSLTVLVSTSL